MQLEVINQELAKFNITDPAIAELRERYMKLTVAGIDDKTGLKAVHEARMDIKTRRVAVTKKGKELREEANDYRNRVIAEEKRIISLLEPIEDHLTDQENRVTEELARIKAEEDARKAALVQARVERLYAVNCRFTGATWQYAGVDLATQADIERFSEDQFLELVQNVESAIAEAESIRAEEQRKQAEREAEIARITAEQEAERIRLAAAQKAIDDAKAELEAEKKRLADAEAARIAEAEAEARRKVEAIKADEEAKIREAEIERARVEAAEAAKQVAEAAALKARIEAEEAAAKKIKEAEEKAAKAIKDAEEKAERERIERENAQKAAEAQAKKEADLKAKKEAAAKLAAERKAARRPDKDKLQTYLLAMQCNVEPELKTPEGIEAMNEMRNVLEVAFTACTHLIEAL